METKKELVGVVGVDAGLMMVGDPCYCLHTKKLPKAFGRDWEHFCDNLEPDITKFCFDLGHEGLAVVVGGFGGDGVFPVYVERDEDGLTKKLIVDFQPK